MFCHHWDKTLKELCNEYDVKVADDCNVNLDQFVVSQ